MREEIRAPKHRAPYLDGCCARKESGLLIYFCSSLVSEDDVSERGHFLDVWIDEFISFLVVMTA